ncbi:hypothetical protein IKX73_01435 [Candidatus Saccharibacteria bacterium]|nr:hypothetical protein [Candidatus Saccharibacteria bacterium]
MSLVQVQSAPPHHECSLTLTFKKCGPVASRAAPPDYKKLGIQSRFFVIAKTGSDISKTISDLATKVIFYDKPEDLTEPFCQIAKEYFNF